MMPNGENKYYISIYCKSQYTSQHFKPEKIFKNLSKPGVDTAGLKSKIYHRVVNQWNSTLNNQYTLFTVIPADCHKYFQLKYVHQEIV